MEGRLHWSEVQVVYGSLRHILRGIETAGRAELSTLAQAIFFYRHARTAKKGQYREA